MKRIMLVDDETDLLELYAMVLESKGYEIITAINGEEAIRIYKETSNNGRKPDIVLMDYRMPVKDGMEATREILQFDRQARIVFVSADASIAEEVVSIGALELILKPFDAKKLILDIEGFMRR